MNREVYVRFQQREYLWLEMGMVLQRDGMIFRCQGSLPQLHGPQALNRPRRRLTVERSALHGPEVFRGRVVVRVPAISRRRVPA